MVRFGTDLPDAGRRRPVGRLRQHGGVELPLQLGHLGAAAAAEGGVSHGGGVLEDIMMHRSTVCMQGEYLFLLLPTNV